MKAAAFYLFYSLPLLFATFFLIIFGIELTSRQINLANDVFEFGFAASSAFLIFSVIRGNYFRSLALLLFSCLALVSLVFAHIGTLPREDVQLDYAGMAFISMLYIIFIGSIISGVQALIITRQARRNKDSK